MKRAVEKTLSRVLPTELWQHIAFECRSLMGRSFGKGLRPDPEKANYINLGSGSVYVGGMINIDFFGTRLVDYEMDLRFPFRIPNDSIDGIVSEHTFEHLTYEHAASALGECFRILKQGGVMRFIVPDMSILIEHYERGDDAWFETWCEEVLIGQERQEMKRFFTKMFAIAFTANFYGHRSCWDMETARIYLENAGFRDIRQLGFREGTEKLLVDKDVGGRRMISLYVEARK